MNLLPQEKIIHSGLMMENEGKKNHNLKQNSKVKTKIPFQNNMEYLD